MGNNNSSDENRGRKNTQPTQSKPVAPVEFRNDDPTIEEAVSAIVNALSASQIPVQQPPQAQPAYPSQQSNAGQPNYSGQQSFLQNQPANPSFQPPNQGPSLQGQPFMHGQQPNFSGQVLKADQQNPPPSQQPNLGQQFPSSFGPQQNFGQLPFPGQMQGPPPFISVVPNSDNNYLGGPIRHHPAVAPHQPFMPPGPPPPSGPLPPYNPMGQPLFNHGAPMSHPYTQRPQFQRGRGGSNGRGNRGHYNANNQNVRHNAPNQRNNQQQNQAKTPVEPDRNANNQKPKPNQQKFNVGSNSSESDVNDNKSNQGGQKKGQPGKNKGQANRGKTDSEPDKSNNNENQGAQKRSQPNKQNQGGTNKGQGNQDGAAKKSDRPLNAKFQQKKKKERALFLESDTAQPDEKVADFLKNLQLTEPQISKKEKMTLSDLAHMYSNRDDDDISVAGPKKKIPLKLEELEHPSDSSDSDSDDEDTASEKTFSTARDTVTTPAKKHGKQLKPKRKGPIPSNALSKSNPGKKAFLYKFILDGIPTLDGVSQMGIPQKQLTRQVEGFLLVSESAKLTTTPKTVMDILAFKQTHADGKLLFDKSKPSTSSKSGQ